MQTNELNENRLRELAGIRPDGDSRVLSVFLNLDPAEFATPPARASEISSVIDDAHRRVRESDGLSHDARKGLEVDVERAATFLRDLSPKGAHGFALFACAGSGLFEGIRLPRPIETRAVINDTPFVEPLVELLGSGGNWMVVLVNRQTGRLLRGDGNGFDELAAIEDNVHGQHSQGGWSQARYQRSVDEDVMDHLKNVADAVFLRFKRASFDHLLLGGPGETRSDFEGRLHPYLRERLAGWIDIDVENSSPDDVAKCARDKIDEHTRGAERRALDRLQEAVGKNGRGAAGLEGTLEALNERRVETLLLMENFDAAGCTCPQCGSVYAVTGGSCPADGTSLDCRDNVVENAMHLALEQSAGVLVVRDEDNARELESRGGIGAVLRF
jgi:peptide subunit release factor 1 (eRF1)